MKKINKDGKVITFYSFKGGVGRSMALANVAVVLSEWGYKVLIIDWDLEAPGLENFFSEFIPLDQVQKSKGLIDILNYENSEKKEDHPPVRWMDCLVNIPVNKDKQSSIDMLTAGNREGAYYENVRTFELQNFYETHNGGLILESFRKEWKSNYDFVLIDSRTGVTDIGGVCTIQMPDILLLMFTATVQGLKGILNVATKAIKGQRQLPFDRVNLLILPVVSRWDNTEFKLAREWTKKFQDGLSDIYSSILPKNVNYEDFILNTKIPYIPFFSFGETLPVIEEGTKNPTSMGYAYQSIASLIATQLYCPDLLLFNRNALIEYANNPTVELIQTQSTKSTRNKWKETFLSVINIYKLLYKKSIKISAIAVIAILITFLGTGSYVLRLSIKNNELKLDRATLSALNAKDKILAAKYSDSLSYLRQRSLDSVSYQHSIMYDSIRKENHYLHEQNQYLNRQNQYLNMQLKEILNETKLLLNDITQQKQQKQQKE